MQPLSDCRRPVENTGGLALAGGNMVDDFLNSK